MLKTSAWSQAEIDHMVQEAVKFQQDAPLVPAEIDRMVQEAVKFLAVDECLVAG